MLRHRWLTFNRNAMLTWSGFSTLHLNNLLIQGVADLFPNEFSKIGDIITNTGLFQCGHILLAFFQFYDCPRIVTRRQHHINKKTSHPSVTIKIWMYINKDEMTKNRSDANFRLFFQQKKKNRHCIPNSFMSGWCMHRTLYVDRPITISSQI